LAQGVSALPVSGICGRGLPSLAATMRACNVLVYLLLAQTWQTASAACNSTMNLHVMGQSGKFTLYTDQQGRSGGITVNIDALRELDASGNAVGTSGSVKHSINTFASQTFTIAPTEVVTIGNGVSAEKVSFDAALGGSVGNVKIDTFVMCEDGVVGNGQESWSVRAGDVKWNIELSSWAWCGCSQGGNAQVGDMIDIDIAVKGLATGQLTGNSLSLGGGAAMQMASLVSIDGTLRNMTAGYPQFNIQGSSTVVTFRFPKFSSRAVYDPVMTTSSLIQSTSPAGRAWPGAWLLACAAVAWVTASE